MSLIVDKFLDPNWGSTNGSAPPQHSHSCQCWRNEISFNLKIKYTLWRDSDVISFLHLNNHLAMLCVHPTATATTRIEINQSTEKEICHDNSSSNHERVHQSMKSFFCVSTFTRSSSSLDTDKARLRRLSVLMRKIEKVDFFLFILSVASQRHERQGSRRANEKCHGEREKREQKLISRSLATHSLTDCVVITLLLPPTPPFPTLWWIIRIFILFIHFRLPLSPPLTPVVVFIVGILFALCLSDNNKTHTTRHDSSRHYLEFLCISTIFFHSLSLPHNENCYYYPDSCQGLEGFFGRNKKNSSCW